MGSHLENLVRTIDEAINEKEKMEDYEEMAEALEKKKIAITARFDAMQVSYIDMLAKKCDMSRSAMFNELATTALMDVMEEMGVTEEFFHKLTEKFNVKGEVNV